MGRSEAARTALLDAAERLFAEHGVAPVSDRRIAEAAGNANHSAVGYHFGGRDGLLRALIERHRTQLDQQRESLAPQPDSLLGDVRRAIVPHVAVLDSLPRPSWRARFLAALRHDPTAADLVRDTSPSLLAVASSVVERLADLDREVVAGRARLTAEMVSTACAQVEAQSERDGSDPRWLAVGDFLADAIAGMLQAPITRAG